MTQTTSSDANTQAKELSARLFQRDRDLSRIKGEWYEEFLDSSLESVIALWRDQVLEKKQLSKETIANYIRYIYDLQAKEILPTKNHEEELFTLDEFRTNARFIVQALLNYQQLSPQEKRFRLNALISFINFLNEVTFGRIEKLVVPQEFELKQTIRSPAPIALTSNEWRCFWTALKKISLRDCLIAKIMCYTARPLLKVLELKVADLNFENNAKVTFTESDGSKSTVGLDSNMRTDLKKYLENTKDLHQSEDDLLFITSKGNPIYRTHLTQVFKRASLEADLGFFVSSKMIQWSEVYDKVKTGILSKMQILEIFQLNNLPQKLEA